MADGYLQAILVLGRNGVSLLNKEQVVHHDGKGTDVNDAAAESGKGKHGLKALGACAPQSFKKESWT